MKKISGRTKKISRRTGGQVVTCLKGKDSNEQTDISALQMLILHSDVIANHVEQCETSANKEDIRKDGRYSVTSYKQVWQEKLLLFVQALKMQ